MNGENVEELPEAFQNVISEAEEELPEETRPKFVQLAKSLAGLLVKGVAAANPAKVSEKDEESPEDGEGESDEKEGGSKKAPGKDDSHEEDSGQEDTDESDEATDDPDEDDSEEDDVMTPAITKSVAAAGEGDPDASGEEFELPEGAVEVTDFLNGISKSVSAGFDELNRRQDERDAGMAAMRAEIATLAETLGGTLADLKKSLADVESLGEAYRTSQDALTKSMTNLGETVAGLRLQPLGTPRYDATGRSDGAGVINKSLGDGLNPTPPPAETSVFGAKRFGLSDYELQKGLESLFQRSEGKEVSIDMISKSMRQSASDRPKSIYELAAKGLEKPLEDE